jgi:hypothetical protein
MKSTRCSCRILVKLKFSRQIFWKNPQIPSFNKIRRVVAELFNADGQTDEQTDGQTDLTKLIFAFRKFAKSS